MLDFNAKNLSTSDVNAQINALMDDAAKREHEEKIERRGPRLANLGASGIGSECLRQVQFDWKFDVEFSARKKRIFARGYAFEDIMSQALASAGFRMERNTPSLAFSSGDDSFKGRGDGKILAGPPVLLYPCLWECKAIKASGWNKLEKLGLKAAYPHYYMQVQIYQAYFGLHDNPALFTAVNVDNCEALHLIVPFDAEEAQAASDRAVAVIKSTRAGELLDRIAKAPTDFRCKMCSHTQRCWENA